MKPIIRNAKTDDAQNLAALSIQVWLHTYAETGIRNSFSEYVLNEFTKNKFEQILSAPDQIIVVAEVEDHLVGYARLKFASPYPRILNTTTELATLYVQEHFKGKGIGSQLLKACAERAAEYCGNPDFWLSVYYKNEPAIAFYKKHGFSKQGSFFFEFGGERHKNYIFAKTPDKEPI